MKKHTRILALILALSMLLMSGCGKKTYNTVQEWYDDNPLSASFLNAAATSQDDSDQMTFNIEGNVIVYGMEMDEAIFGESEELDAKYKEYFDNAFEGQREAYLDVIEELSGLTGIPANQMSLRIDIFNPGADTPGYTKTFTAE